MQLIHQTGSEQGVVQFATAFAQHPPHALFHPQPAERGSKIDFAPAADLDFVGDGPQLPEFVF